MSDPTSGTPRSVLVVGAGLAAAQTVGALRDAGFAGTVTVLGAEGLAPYDRPPLSKHLLDRVEPAWLAQEIGVDVTSLADEVHLDSPATALVVEQYAVSVRTAAGEHRADAAVVATGAHATLPDAWTGARVLHTAADAHALRTALRPGTRLVVVGAGWIGAEVAGVAAHAGVDVTVVEAAQAPLARVLGAHVGGLTVPWYDERGVRLVTRAHVTRVRPDAVELADGTTLAADVVLAAVGATPTTDWIGGALPRDGSGALRVDEGFAVLGAPAGTRRVRAVGDVILRRSPRHGWVPGGHWDGALRDPATLVDDLLVPGRTDRPDRAPYVFSTMLGRELTLFGLPGPLDDVVLRGDPAHDPGWTALWYRAGSETLTAALTVDRPRDVAAARRLFTGPALPVLPRGPASDAARPLRA